MEVIEEIVPEPRGGAHRDYEGAAAAISEALVRHLEEMKDWSGDQLKQDRYEKFRKIGSVTFESPTPATPIEAPEEPVRVDAVNNLSVNAE